MKQLRNINLLLLSALLATSCSNEETPTPTINPATDQEAVELGITAGVALTKSAITGGNNVQTGEGADVMQAIAVYALGNTTSYGGSVGNNYALYSQSSGSWTNNASSNTDKIFLTSEEATIYAYHPAYTPDKTDHYMKNADGGSALKVSSAFAATSTIPITVFPGGEKQNDSEALKTQSTIPATATGSAILSAPGEVDYMWAIDGSTTTNSTGENKQPTASNGKQASGKPKADAHKVTLKMKHALSMVSFKIYKESNYTNTGTLTKIVLKNVSESQDADKVLATYATMTMKIADGTIETTSTKSAATYTRYIGTSGTTIAGESDKDNAPKYSILVLPEKTSETAFDKSKVQVVFTIDGAEYAVPLAANTDNTTKWEAGNNYLYTAKLSGKELSITSVTVQAWEDGTVPNDELPVN
ncbi:MAG: fimbrillin family protein [Parabacteroides sp.]|nr:fimbrillin family protein [Parabacteroides sp.]